VEGAVPALRAALADRGAAVLQAEPGAGKSTVVPLRLLDAVDGRILVLQPRRIAARATARRMAALLGDEVGGTVGYRTRDDRRTSDRTRIEVVTDGILTRRLQRDPTLDGTGLVVFDEVHERHLHAEVAMALCLDARAALRPDLDVVAMSATLDTDRLAALLAADGPPVPVVRGGGQPHPVTVRWSPPGLLDPSFPPAAVRVVAGAVRRALLDEPGDVLVFLPGAGEIGRVARELGKITGVDVRPLHGSLSAADQDAALAPAATGRRVVLATDLAESSLTVEGVRVVIDAGLVRRPRHDPRRGLTRLHTTVASRAAAEQRAGRAGRTGPGVTVRLWSEGEHAARRPFAVPEIQAVDLAALALELAVWGTGAEDLPFLDQPPAIALAEARALLVTLGVLDGDGRPTEVGRAVAELPVHPRLGRMLAAERSPRAAVLAALVEEGDGLGRDTADVAERVRLVMQPSAPPRAAAVARRSRDLARRVGAGGGRVGDRDLDDLGILLARAFPDRLAQARGGGRFRLRSGAGVSLSATDPLRAAPFLVVAATARGTGADDRIVLAAALSRAEIEAVAAGDVDEVTTTGWDPGRDDLRVRHQRRVGALVLDERDGPAEPGPATVAALVARVADQGLSLVPGTAAAAVARLRRRVAFAHTRAPERWPDPGDEALLAALDDWLAPALTVAGAARRADLDRLDVTRALWAWIGPGRRAELDRAAPATLTLAGGRTVPIDYDTDRPVIRVRAQDLYGTTTHPTVSGEPVVIHVLSPAGRPIQVTADVPGFWAGSWTEVRREMAGRYPKHHWPADPASASRR
jgi:ATP-dependent helicase HrpB